MGLVTGTETVSWLDHAALLFMAGELRQAEQLCQGVLAHAPDHAGALRQLGLIRLVSGDPAAAFALLHPLQDTFPTDPDLAIALAEAAWASNGAADAIRHYRHALALAPGRVRARVRLGLALLTTGLPGQAVQQLERATRMERDPLALTYLGMALLADGRPADAVAVLDEAARRDPRDASSAFHLGQALRELGRIGEAVDALTDAVRRGPGQAHLRVALGDALFARGDHGAGKAELRRATELDASQPLAWAKLGDMEQLTGDAAAALGCYRRAVALDGGNPELLTLLGNALLAMGDQVAGTRELGRSMQARWAKPARRGETLRVGILAAPGDANTPTNFIIDRTRFAVTPVFMLDGFDYPHHRIANAYDVLFNAVSDPDAAPGALAHASELAPAWGLPIANPPGAIPGTVRERMAACLAGIEGLHMPGTLRCRRVELGGRPIDGPVLVRPVGSHGGRDITLAHTAEEVCQAAAALTCDEAYVTEFVDFRSKDGLYRKLRLVFVGGRPFPVHLAIGEHWLSHYFRTSMVDMASWRAEEAAFVSDYEIYLGPTVCRALDEVAARVSLDFFGIDGAIGPDGRLVVFECNASMLVRHVDRPAMFDYKRAPAERIRTAMGDLLQRLATTPPQEINPSP